MQIRQNNKSRRELIFPAFGTRKSRKNGARGICAQSGCHFANGRLLYVVPSAPGLGNSGAVDGGFDDAVAGDRG